MYRPQPHPTMIGTAWRGHHVVILRCNPYTNQFLGINTSLEAPVEPTHPTCTETLSRFLSIGYTMINTTMISQTEIQYVLIKK
ncbi:hypothetical protein M670_02730 [Schinkia azotoformans MEV2011]|uniref:Uncharacterized protein n=2 Tax=Schinkia azotoformans TaxID=1454 RepID=K6D8R7_SCHAZ|nr:hypothetical protein [Schinkia azotoformans]EKN68927.1 hypothetical protein BAZO_02567 [Schinkia azotoformans LMG 9581]KEF37974.1 hypothetical protein M670_02730 [Schinkia azotoformans MEV2011]MEC1640996.1 hypothetical protein [Schinkia azotoformans]MEC1696331.1 hypothetical protein [Schinkia azotoformans]MEC1717390.1 hypothetical protein [Schinkia azotoformans]